MLKTHIIILTQHNMNDNTSFPQFEETREYDENVFFEQESLPPSPFERIENNVELETTSLRWEQPVLGNNYKITGLILWIVILLGLVAIYLIKKISPLKKSNQ